MRFDIGQGRSAIGLLAAFAGCAFAVGPVLGQGPNPFISPNEKLKADVKFVVDSLMAGAFPNAGPNEAERFDAFFNNYMLLKFADPGIIDPGKISLADLRRSFHARFFGAGKKGAVYDRLHDLTLAMMNSIIKAKFPNDPKYDPLRCSALRYNAMLVIGDLNREDPLGSKPTPSLEALQYMLNAVDNPSWPDYLRVAALLGIERQAECYGEHPLPSDKQQALIKSMLTLLKQRDPPPNRDIASQTWLRRMAAQILGLIGQPGVNTGGDEVAVALAKEFRDSKNMLSLRCAAAAAFSDMKFTGSEKINTADIALDMGVFALEILNDEQAWAEANAQEPNRRRLKSALGSVADGLVGRTTKHGIFSDISPPENKEAVKDLVRAVYKVSKIADTASLSATDLTKKREELEKALQDPKLPRKVALPKPAPVAPSKTGPGPAQPGGPTASSEPLADSKGRALRN